MQTTATSIDLEELTKRLQALDGAENKQAIVCRLADVIEAAHARGASYATICAALHGDVPLSVPTLKTYLRRAKSRRAKRGTAPGRVELGSHEDRAKTSRVQPRDLAPTPRLTNGHQAHSRDDIISAGSFKPRADRSDI